MKKQILAPSILNADFLHLSKEIDIAEKGGARFLHLDVIDGVFAPSISFGANIIYSIRTYTNLFLDVHLMIENPSQYIADFVHAGADSITIHAEGAIHLHRLIYQIKGHGIKAGVALNPATPISLIEPILSDIDMVLLMTVNPGFGGQSFIKEVLSKMTMLSHLKSSKKYSFAIEVDGGITPREALWCSQQGANIFVVGSYIYYKETDSEKLQAMKNIKKSLGIGDSK
ncbi:ribulose-phosphate 3-epimerase [Oceanobacillus oncorhynchi]|uniref:Ribulose-phosphate 3-epimerase n=1 Tax=Oceanobacillus oncorhynchi TaxID=545501 RepID=A0A0A1M598_9BACI|nr:ribulose-phosphate 3-epimerase [Oceanobacillus oncorhynchi]MDM8099098.1 ribulose-phosphate 3-epimerase [Oceanobacillus oncorhynchi]CEI80465.1 Ribulose-phosphate 3-epimerase [Oceanobacillus oncorhynchi]